MPSVSIELSLNWTGTPITAGESGSMPKETSGGLLMSVTVMVTVAGALVCPFEVTV